MCLPFYRMFTNDLPIFISLHFGFSVTLVYKLFLVPSHLNLRFVSEICRILQLLRVKGESATGPKVTPGILYMSTIHLSIQVGPLRPGQ